MSGNNIGITVRNKFAEGDGSLIVCGNEGYTVSFDLDDEWAAHTSRTMRVTAAGRTADVSFTGTSAMLPALPDCLWVRIAILSDGTASTPAVFQCIPSAAQADFPPASGGSGGGDAQ